MLMDLGGAAAVRPSVGFSLGASVVSGTGDTSVDWGSIMTLGSPTVVGPGSIDAGSSDRSGEGGSSIGSGTADSSPQTQTHLWTQAPEAPQSTGSLSGTTLESTVANVFVFVCGALSVGIAATDSTTRQPSTDWIATTFFIEIYGGG